MTPAQLLARMEARRCGAGLSVPGSGSLPAAARAGGSAESRHRRMAARARSRSYDLAETALAEVIDDARALSLFASERVIFGGKCGSGAAPHQRRR